MQARARKLIKRLPSRFLSMRISHICPPLAADQLTKFFHAGLPRIERVRNHATKEHQNTVAVLQHLFQVGRYENDRRAFCLAAVSFNFAQM
jgi:hypothetical protein